jgi:hypothetical protein
MLKTMLWVGCIAALVCWAIGAYNRLVRLRAATIESLKVLQNFEIDTKVSNDLHDQDIQLEVKIQMSKTAHDTSVLRYNQAIKQFPAAFIATLFSFKPYIHSIGKPE